VMGLLHGAWPTKEYIEAALKTVLPPLPPVKPYVLTGKAIGLWWGRCTGVRERGARVSQAGSSAASACFST
jgi:hypothetical protein